MTPNLQRSLLVCPTCTVPALARKAYATGSLDRVDAPPPRHRVRGPRGDANMEVDRKFRRLPRAGSADAVVQADAPPPNVRGRRAGAERQSRDQDRRHLRQRVLLPPFEGRSARRSPSLPSDLHRPYIAGSTTSPLAGYFVADVDRPEHGLTIHFAAPGVLIGTKRKINRANAAR